MLHTSSSTSARLQTVKTTGAAIALAVALIGGTSTAAAAAPPTIRHAHTLPVRAAPTWVIHIDTAGHQEELDQCLWVRMDFTATVPIVGMHNFCGGDFVLDMVWGQTVQLVGQGLDGTYLVTTDRVAFPGDSPSGVTAGIVATVFLQTCYWDREQGMRLVALTLLPEVPRVIAGAS